MIGFLDNDIILKLCVLDLLDEAIVALNLKYCDMHVMSTAIYFLRSNRSSPKEGRERAIAFVKDCQKASAENSNELELLQTIDGIDIGEATLLAATQNLSTFVFMTGDKKCIASLGNASEIETTYQRLQGRVICLEQVILLLIQRLGFEMVKSRVLPTIDYDKSLKTCFGSGNLAIETNVVMTLENYIKDLRQKAPGLLADMSQF